MLNMTWILNQFGRNIETGTKANPTDDYAPTVGNVYDGSYTVSAIMYYKTQLGEVLLRTASIERTATNCKVNGAIRVSPPNGTVLITNFNLTTSDWVPTEPGTTLEYRFGVVDPSRNNEPLFLNSFSSSTTLITTLPIHGNVTVVVECRSASGYVEQRSTSVIVTTGESENGCTNPRGCAPHRKSHKLQPWAKALIGVLVSIVVIVLVLLLVIIGLIIVKKVLVKHSENSINAA